MGRIPFIPNKEEFREISMEKKGYIVAIAKHFGVNPSCIYALQNRDKEIREILLEARKIHHEAELDLAVSLNYHFMQNYQENPGLASLHVRYTLDKRGQIRGYKKDGQDNSSLESETRFDSKMDQVLELLCSDRNIEESNINSDTKS